jgi:hypothetical protein
LFTKVAADDAAAGPGDLTFALLRPEGGAFIVVAAGGHALSPGQRVAGAAASAVRAALGAPAMVSTPVLGSDAHRQLGFALGGPAAPSGMGWCTVLATWGR